jgi:hypothetical protein
MTVTPYLLAQIAEAICAIPYRVAAGKKRGSCRLLDATARYPTPLPPAKHATLGDRSMLLE